jgi:CzcA family heavy metal efflux pump
MWIVRLALSRPYTFIVIALMLLILGIVAIKRTPTDILPNINIPIVSVIWQYTGLPPDEMAGRITSVFERVLPTLVDNIEHIESQSLNGVAVVKIFFQPSVNIDLAITQVSASAQTITRLLPPGINPPEILSYSASSVPVMQLVLSSLELSEQEINDLGNNFIRTQLATIEGASLPYPYGGKQRQIMIDLDTQAMQTYGITPTDVSNALNAQNLIFPAGTQKIGLDEYVIRLNSSPKAIEELNHLPIRTQSGAIYYIRDVAHVRDGFPPQTNIVRVDGSRAVLMNIQKTGDASTLSIVQGVKDLIPKIKDSMPKALDLKIVNDESIFVKAAISSVIREAVIAACLTGLMILLFLGSWRSTLIITISIPLSILASIIALSALGQTFNIMTLGGLALAVGILVDDATVTIENINWNLEQGKDVETAILDGASQIAIPAFVSTLCICIVLLPMFFLKDIAHFLFVPMAEAVIFAVLASYGLSRTLVPTLAKYMLHKKQTGEIEKNKFAIYFQKFSERYHQLLQRVMDNRNVVILGSLAFFVGSILIITPWVGSDFFPSVDAGKIKIHISAPTGTRVEETANLADKIDAEIRKIIPADEIESIVDNIGLPISGINLSYSNSGTIGPEDMDIFIDLKPHHHPIAAYIKKMRIELPQQFPGVDFSFLPADIVNQILNFGLPAPINVQVIGWNIKDNYQYAAKLLEEIKKIPGIVDAQIKQKFDYPQLNVDVDRSFANELGLTQLDVATSMFIALAGSFQIAPTFWLDYDNGVSYPLVIQTPQYRMTSLQDLENIPMTDPREKGQILGALANISRSATSAVESHYNVQSVIDIYANIQGRDLGAVSRDVEKMIKNTSSQVPKGSTIATRGQMQTKQTSFTNLYYGLAFSILLVYLLIVINFQSWIDPLIIICALPAAIAGIVWMLFITGTTFSVPSLTGAIMCMGVATANSILVVSFARTQMSSGDDAITSAIKAGITRLRPVLMTALAMIIGMLPMALGLGEGGEQNAPLGRAVIGGLLFATFATLFFVPLVFSVIHGRKQ